MTTNAKKITQALQQRGDGRRNDLSNERAS